MQDHDLQLDPDRRDVILMLGITGVGKSTLAEILFGDLPALHSTFDLEALCYKISNIKAPPTAEQNQFVSDTVCPQLFTDLLHPNLAISDCPGFEDTRGTSNEIATGLYLSNIVQHADRVKLVVTVGYDAVQPNVDRKKFTETVLHGILDFVQNTNVFKTGVFLLVNKYANPAGEFSDDAIVTSIAKFLEKAQVYAVEKWPEREEAIDALFNGSWLLKDADGKYTNIGFARMITGEGPLEKMESVTQSRDRLRSQLLDNPNFNFISCDTSDFGRPISQSAKLEIRKVQKRLVTQADDVLQAVALKVERHFAGSRSDKLQLSRHVHHFADFLDDLEELEGAESGLSLKTLELIRQLGRNLELDLEAELVKLNETVRNLKFLGGVDVTESSETWKDAHQKMALMKDKMEEDVALNAGIVVMFPNGPVCV